MKDFILFLLPAVILGVPAGMGMGGGTLLIPLLTIFFSVEQFLAQGANLIAFIPMSIVACVIHAKNHMFKLKGILFAIIPALLFAVLGTYLAKIIDTKLLKRIFGGFIILLSVFSVFCDSLTKKAKNNKSEK